MCTSYFLNISKIRTFLENVTKFKICWKCIEHFLNSSQEITKIVLVSNFEQFFWNIFWKFLNFLKISENFPKLLTRAIFKTRTLTPYTSSDRQIFFDKKLGFLPLVKSGRSRRKVPFSGVDRNVRRFNSFLFSKNFRDFGEAAFRCFLADFDHRARIGGLGRFIMRDRRFKHIRY